MSVMNQPGMTTYYIWEKDYCKFYDKWQVGGTTIEEDNGSDALTFEEILAQWDKKRRNRILLPI